jgi:uncharacterized membrane protein YhaH (DUF805 family)
MTENPDATPISSILGYRGKATRGQFWIGMAMLLGALVFALFLFAPYFSTTGNVNPFSKIMVFVLLGVAIWLQSAFTVARLRDRGRPVWMYLVYGLGPLTLFMLGWRYEGNISNQPTLISQVLQYAAYALFLIALVDLGFAKSVGGTTSRTGE